MNLISFVRDSNLTLILQRTTSIPMKQPNYFPIAFLAVSAKVRKCRENKSACPPDEMYEYTQVTNDEVRYV